MIDRDRVLAKLDELHGYLGELRSVVPGRYEDYQQTAARRACERLLHIAVEAVLDVCALLVTGLRLGLPGEEDDLFEKLRRGHAISEPLADTLRRMKGLRNLLVHEYGRVNDRMVFDVVSQRLGDFEDFKGEVLALLRK
ncbi:MAG: DUF86 domain-containing protein [Candidatus Rokubacteria bacterium]|nr:DUF86 domain-containing protein [Candidatus Rokubacteria bacterium]